jgi:3-carboxy-cis,cis-muconate cycloisomerase
MLGRTLLQPAAPITFGLKAAGWYAGARRSWHRLSLAFDEALLLQFGGATGTLAALGDKSVSVSQHLAAELRLPEADAPWHTHRDRMASLVANCGIHVGALGKIARDVSLLMQHEVSEVAETGGGSSTMPQKRNPVGCAVALAAATRAPGLVASYLTGMVQEHERSVGGWHAEWPTVTAIVQTTGASLSAMAAVVDDLTIDVDRMRANLDATNDTVFAERLMMLLAPAVGRDRAHQVLSDAAAESQRTRQRLLAVVKALPDIAPMLTTDQWESVARPEDYLGAAEEFRRRLLASP